MNVIIIYSEHSPSSQTKTLIRSLSSRVSYSKAWLAKMNNTLRNENLSYLKVLPSSFFTSCLFSVLSLGRIHGYFLKKAEAEFLNSDQSLASVLCIKTFQKFLLVYVKYFLYLRLKF